METSKQKAIREAYGEFWEELKERIDENGWDTELKFYEIDTKFFDWIVKGHGIYITRPKSLQGIETNNGWIKIESESDLPKDHIFSYKIGKMFENGKFFQFSESVNLTTVKNWFGQKKITHYMLNQIESDPIY